MKVYRKDGHVDSTWVNGEGAQKQAKNNRRYYKTNETLDLKGGFKSSHWDEPNVLAHARVNDRDIPGVGKSLHIEEIQSDWGQAGRKQGFKSGFHPEDFDIEELPNKGGFKLTHKPTGAEVDTYKTKGEANAFIRKGKIPTRLGNVLRPEDIRKGEIPNMPMEKTWDELTIKRMIKEASDNGYDAISWTPGEAQVARYDLSKKIDNIKYMKNANNKYDLLIKPKENYTNVIKKENLSEKELENLIGKEVAEKIVKGEGAKSNVNRGVTTLSGLDLKVGGKGMKAFYDKMMVDKVNQIAKKFGGKVETKEIPISTKEKLKDVEGMSSFEAAEYMKQNKNKGQPIHVLKLTPELKKVATEKGFPLFTGGLQFSKPLEQPSFEERWRERVPEGEMPVPAIRDYPIDRQAPGRFLEKRPVRLTKMPPDFNPFTNKNAL